MSTSERKDSAQSGSVTGRKRSRIESETNQEENRKRGRPRLDSQDESAADRRRTQIRVAQRAYRQRKETTIDDLRKQVKELQETIHGMNRSFRDLSERCMAEIVPTSVAIGLEEVSRQYSDFMNSVNMSTTSSNPQQAEDTVRSDSAINQKLEAHTPSSFGLGSVEWSQIPPMEPVSQTPSMNDHVTDPSPPVQIQNFRPIAPTRYQSTSPENEPGKLLLPKSLESPVTYNYKERTFARRLHRASCEYAYGLACDPSRLPANFNSVFRLTFKVAGNVERLKQSLRSTLSRDLREPLSNWSSPYMHIGGAGTHYPKSIEEGGPPFSGSGSGNITNVGPYKLVDPTSKEYVTPDVLLQGVPGVQGEFFDAYDVEGYLAEKGIHIDPASSFAVIELSESETSRNSLSPVSPIASNPAHKYHFSTTPSNTGPDYDTSGSDRTVDRKDNGIATAVQEYMQPRHTGAFSQKSDSMAYTSQAYNSNEDSAGYQMQKSKRVRVKIDVGEFIKLMSVSGVCLMRAPGYRRKNVDIALRRSIVNTTSY